MRRTLALPANGTWRDAPLKPSVNRLAEAFSTPLWIDRRVDPTVPVTLGADQSTFAALLEAFAQSGDMRVVPIDRLIYCGPEPSAAALPQLAEQWRKSPPPGMKRRGETRWARLATPRAVATEIAAEAGCHLENEALIPHDLWPAGSTPKLTAGDRLMLVLIGFDLRWVADPSDRRTIRVEPIDYRTMPSSSATLTSLIGDPQPNGAVKQLYTLRVVEQPFGAVMGQLAKQLGRELRINSKAIEDDSKRISFQVERASLEELLNAIGTAADVAVVASPREIVVSRRE